MRLKFLECSPSSTTFLVLFMFFATTQSRIRLQSPLVTDFGDWGKVERCPNGTFAVGVQLKVESPQPPLFDDTGLNGIRLFCGDLSGKMDDITLMPKIQSSVGGWGTWRTEFLCQSGLVVGFQLRSEAYQYRYDDTAANNLRVICSDGQTIEGEGTAWGDWTAVQQCRKRQAVCSIQTQVEPPKHGHDDTALNNVRMECCDIPNPSDNCRPTDFWELVAECDNTNAFTPTTCTYERKIGMGYSTVQYQPTAPVTRHEKSILENVGFSLGVEAQVLSQKFQVESGLGGKTGYNWASSRTDTWNQESTTKVSFEVPPGVRSSMVQVVGACGNYLVRTAKFQRIDMISSPGGGGTGSPTMTVSTPLPTSPMTMAPGGPG